MCSSHLRLELNLVKGRRNPLHPGHGMLSKSNTCFVSTQEHRVDLRCAAKDSEHGYGEKGFRRRRKGPKPVAELGLESLDLVDQSHVCQASVNVELGVLTGYVLIGQI